MDKIIIRVVDPSIINAHNIDESINQKPDKYMKYLIKTTFISCIQTIYHCCCDGFIEKKDLLNKKRERNRRLQQRERVKQALPHEVV